MYVLHYYGGKLAIKIVIVINNVVTKLLACASNSSSSKNKSTFGKMYTMQNNELEHKAYTTPTSWSDHLGCAASVPAEKCSPRTMTVLQERHCRIINRPTYNTIATTYGRLHE